MVESHGLSIASVAASFEDSYYALKIFIFQLISSIIHMFQIIQPIETYKIKKHE